MLGGVCLPGALLLSTIWRRDVWWFQFKGYSRQVLLLIVMVLVTHRAMVRGLLKSTKARGLSLLGGVLCLLGLLVFASSAIAEVDGVRRILHWGGFIIWTIGVLSMLGHCATISAKREPGGTCR